MALAQRHSVPAWSTPPSVPGGVPVDGAIRGLLNRMRFHAATCRAAARLDIHEACAHLTVDPVEAERTAIEVTLRVLGQALMSDPVFYQPGEAGLSFDEAWLVAALTARADGDEASLTFLLRRRIGLQHRRIIAFLLSQLTQNLTKTV
ncbi:MAG: hypothetical protein AAF914_04530 [Pseudomonadota bacterium]